MAHASLPITPTQIKAARALLSISAEELARAAGVSVATINRAEVREAESTGMIPSNERAVRSALEAAGVVFIEPDENGGPGVRLRSA